MYPFLVTQLGIMSGGPFIPLQERVYRQKTASGSFPEARLYPMMFGALWVVYLIARCRRSTSFFFLFFLASLGFYLLLSSSSRLQAPTHGFIG